jgi:hypothetical protein
VRARRQKIGTGCYREIITHEWLSMLFFQSLDLSELPPLDGIDEAEQAVKPVSTSIDQGHKENLRHLSHHGNHVQGAFSSFFWGSQVASMRKSSDTFFKTNLTAGVGKKDPQGVPAPVPAALGVVVGGVFQPAGKLTRALSAAVGCRCRR